MTEQPDDVTTPREDDATGGTPDEPTRNAETDENREKLLQTLQDKAARVNAAEAEAKALRARLDAIERAQSPAVRGSDPRAERLDTVRRFADGSIGEGPDPVAAEVLALREELSMTVNEIANLRELDRVSDESKRNKIKDHFNANRHRLGDVKAAKAEIEREELQSALEQQRIETEKLRKALEATSKRQNPDRLQTHAREVTAAEHQARKMSSADWKSRQDQLSAAYDAGDLKAGETLRKEQTLRRENKIIVEG